MDKRFSRRHFIQTTTTGGIGLLAVGMTRALARDRSGRNDHATGLPTPNQPIAAGSHPPYQTSGAAGTAASAAADLYMLSHSLTATWAANLLSLQALDTSRPDEYGGILDPNFHIVPGRCGDSIYPFLHMARRTNDHRYLDAATLLYEWMDRRVSQPDGSWLNEPVKDSWKGTTVFTSIALCETLRFHGDLLDPALKTTLHDRLLRAGDFIYDNVNIDYGNINYPLSASYAMSLLGNLLDVQRFRERGRMLAHQGMKFITADGFVAGEGTPYYQTSKKGCLSVDLGYNVEESLPSLAMYGLLNKDEEVLQAVTRSLQTHMEFMLPDGGWDNSWGTRNYKWTYWGSRTSDGCQPGYALLADRDPRFLRVALLNTQLLESCTHDGLLYGGPHYKSHGTPPSIHHSFCHCKALTTILDHGITGGPAAPGAAGTTPPSPGGSPLPRESAYGSRFFPDIQTWLIAIGSYRATVTGYDREYKSAHNGHATGGALSMLWHERTGPLLVASMNAYQLVEAGNMQIDSDPLSMPLTPRMELNVDDKLYTNIADLEATISVEKDNQIIRVTTNARLVDKDHRDPAAGPVHCNAIYTFSPEKITLSFQLGRNNAESNIANRARANTANPSEANIRIVLPVISMSGEPVEWNGKKTMHIHKKSSLISIHADQPITRLPTTGDRLFNFVPGLEAIPLAISGSQAKIDIVVSA